MKIVVALDGHLLLPQDARVGISGQKEAAVRIAGVLGEMVKAGHELVVTHGNGSQVGNMLFRAEVARHAVYALPLDVCGADTQGATGYLLQQALHNWLLQQGIEQEITTIVAQVIVDEGDLEAANLTKGVGPYFDQQRAQAYENSRGWDFMLIPGHGYQRVVPALLPKRIVEINSIRYLLERGVIVICTGGGGVPVQVDAQGVLHGTDLDESTRAKLVASQHFFETGGQSVLIVSPEQMGARPRLGWGVRLLADDVVSEQERT